MGHELLGHVGSVLLMLEHHESSQETSRLCNKVFSALLWPRIESESTFTKLRKFNVNVEFRLKLMKEAAIHSVLEHPHIVKLFGIVFEPGNYGLILEYMDYGDLEEYLHGHEIDLEEKLRLIREVASGMKYLHSRTPPVIHGDLKFQNVLVSNKKTAKVLKVTLQKNTVHTFT